ncbi:Vacuolar fusion protein MON1 [Lasiodiplodia theobromae]|uniref:Vacuolar fusion protein MON1 n=1 Tax=Lasiodiplodia theobromae TaxID=45133 RepID=A0A5N5DEI6_9PEZI|nr:Vacuolar fusion protein MON1 [Lasiodiplodia theobromae]KAB2576135.1 Vacuolar fusion protein MON1 [Lasiodiplodia theobromae]KAF4545710.1 Vacuolar fusion protein MON1 [Lasiodiplodia theobromae]
MAEPPPPAAPAEPQPAPAEPDSDCARPSSSHGEPEATTAVKDFDPAAPDDPVPQEDASQGPSREGTPPPLPPRPRNLTAKASTDSFRFSASANGSPRPTLQSKATTALSIHDVQSYSETLRDVIASPASRHFSFSSGARPGPSTSGSETGDATSVKSYVPTLEAGADVESILGEVMSEQESSVWRSLGGDFPNVDNEAALFPENPSFRRAFEREFDELEEFKADGSNEETLTYQWRSKLKHFLILSSAGKPIYSRHGDDQLIANTIGVVQTIISFYQDADNVLKGFTAGDARFVVLSKGPLNLVAISKLGESEGQLRTQLESLYMQILSTLTLPSMERMFRARASTDLRRPLQGTETLLSALADGFTRGSPSTLLSALECLRLRKSHRKVIDNTLLQTRAPNLLYGLLVAAGRLVSVVRPKKHSLHPGDLQLIFNMLFEAGSVKAAGGENWIPLCLPGFNNTGYLYMYVSFINVNESNLDRTAERPLSSSGQEDEVAILLISANKESFFELREMRDQLVSQLEKNGGLQSIRTAVNRGRFSCTDIVPGTVLRHFIYKSRGNVQFTMPSYEPYFTTALDRRLLISLYAQLHSHLHTRPTHLKIHHGTSTHHISLAWTTPLFELYAIAPGTTSRAALAQAANKVIQWVKREEERVFIIGGAVF